MLYESWLEIIKYIQQKLERKIDKNEEVSRRVEKALNDEKEQIDKRFDSALDRFDNFDKIVAEHIENIGEIESKSLDITNKIDSINELPEQELGRIQRFSLNQN